MIQNLWNEADAARWVTTCRNPEVGLRVYSSRLLGSEQRLGLRFAGSTSVKAVGTDLLGNDVAALYINGNGSDLSLIETDSFVALQLEPLSRLERLERLVDERAIRFLRGNLADSDGAEPPIDSLLHAFLPPKFVDHTRAPDILALANQEDSENLIRRVFGDKVGYVPFNREVFLLAKAAAAEYRRYPQLRGLVLDRYGLVTFGETAGDSYTRTLELTNAAADFIHRNRRRPVFVPLTPSGTEVAARAQFAPVIRGCLANASGKEASRRWILDFRCADLVLEFVNGENLPEYATRGAISPEYLIRAKASPLILPLPRAAALEQFRIEADEALSQYVSRYLAVERCRTQPTMGELGPVPWIVLVRGCGLFGIGRSAEDAAIAADLAENWIDTVTAAESFGRFCPLGENHRLATEEGLVRQAGSSVPGELRLAGQVVLITGGAGTIGRAIGAAFAKEGAEVVIADVDGNKAKEVAASISETALGISCDVCNGESVRSLFDRSCERFGGIDIVVSNAGAAWSGAMATLADDVLRKSFELNFFAHQFVAQNAVRVFGLQRTGGAILFNVSKQAINPGPNFGAYGIPKAATLALARQYALEYGRDKIRVNAVNADRIRSGLLTDEMIRSRALARGLSEEEYLRGNLLGLEVTAEDVAQAFVHQALAAKTTGDVTTVDGGNVAAFLR